MNYYVGLCRLYESWILNFKIGYEGLKGLWRGWGG